VRIAILHGPGSATEGGSVIPKIVRTLRERGAIVELMPMDGTLTDLRRLQPTHDLYVLKAGTAAALSIGGALHAAGASTFNPHPAVAAIRDKVVAATRLARAGVPIPDSWCTASPATLARALDDGPIVVKPHRGSQGSGVIVVRRESELASLASPTPLFAQRYLAPDGRDGRDRKLYRIGADVFGVRRVWPARRHADKLGEPFEPSEAERDVTVRCGAAFGIDVYGVDVVLSGGRPRVIDMSSFPGFKGVPDAAPRLADRIWDAAERAAGGGLSAAASCSAAPGVRDARDGEAGSRPATAEASR